MNHDQREATLALHGWVWLEYPGRWIGMYKEGWGLVMEYLPDNKDALDPAGVAYVCADWVNIGRTSPTVPLALPGTHSVARRRIVKQIFSKGIL